MKAKNKNIRSIEKETYEDLYVCMYNAKEKRKHLLTGIKNSLVMQGEFEKINEIRKDKIKVLNEIKRGMEDLNKSYQQLKKELPNVKNVISYTEKELDELEKQIHMLKEEEKINQRDIKIEEYMQETLRDNKGSLKKIIEKKEDKKLAPKATKDENTQTTQNPKNLTKLDRIKNNLKVIESKLKEI